MRVRQFLAIGVFAGLAVASANPFLLRMPMSNLAALRDAMTAYADRNWYPEYPAFLADVRRATRRGDTIALVVPGMQWDNGYSYAYYRASYFLEGREVLPLITRDDKDIPQNFARARYVAAWRMRVPHRDHVVIASHGGVLLVR